MTNPLNPNMTHNTCDSSKEKGKKWQGKRQTRNKDIAQKNSVKINNKRCMPNLKENYNQGLEIVLDQL